MASTVQSSPSERHPALVEGLRDFRHALWGVVVFSAGVNLLMLAGPLYMLQVYDRVLSSRSVSTLVALTILLVGAYAIQGTLDLIRSRIMTRAAALLDERLGETVHSAIIGIAVQNQDARDAGQPIRDLDQVRTFLTSTGPTAFIDLPWVPLFLGLCFLLHPWLGLTALSGAVLLFVLTLLAEWTGRKPARELAQLAGVRGAAIEADRRNGESAVAMGMRGALAERWLTVNEKYLGAMARAGDFSGMFGNLSKVVRILLQSAILGVGAYLVIHGELSAGAMIAASIMMGRALAPVEAVIANWRGFIQARQGLRRLTVILGRLPVERVVTQLRAPSQSYEVEHVTVVPPGSRNAVLSEVNFRLEAGEALGIIGPSGAGKTSLVRTLLGIWPAARGSIRLDGAKLDQWNAERLGRHVGFVSQNVDLFDGTIAENISRMSPDADSDSILEAASRAGAHTMILGMPGGYDMRIGDGGAALSGGQRQRIALARALYGNPFLLVLDEAGSNLDHEGETALSAAIHETKARGGIVIVIGHRPTAIAPCDKVLVLAGGAQKAFGPREEVLRSLRSPQNLAVPPANLKVVRESIGGER